tara:strand:- start:547 stop:768 length:222 start_codon:yes stop_codon:yes gene_type:complete
MPKMTETTRDKKGKFQKDHPYMKRLDETLKQYSVVKVADVDGAHHGEDYEEMKQDILDSLFMRYAGVVNNKEI